MLAPPMLIASIYGMNTDVLPFAHGTTSFIIVLLIIIGFFIGPIIYFRWKNGFKEITPANFVYKKAPKFRCFFIFAHQTKCRSSCKWQA